ncbi:Hexokinase type 2 [Nosema granulosis]|uniref:Hexokinase type 2 n=1 Tax=Nosema granulosis TaxID=83296 RepID=A0A9P6L0E0_9MICR|nr:Hexokinase type 2 [Nosema granulosis]
MKLLLTMLAYLASLRASKHEEFSQKDVDSVILQYKSHLEEYFKNLDEDKIKTGFIKDIVIDKSKDVPEKNILVWDLGGSFFKLCFVKIKIINGKISCRSGAPKNISYPQVSDETRKIHWEDWAVENMLEFVKEQNIIPDSSSLIVSYPLKYDGEGDASVERFTKFFCFNNTTSDKKIISSIQESINKQVSTQFPDCKLSRKELLDRLTVKTVLNDSVANYFSSKYKETAFGIGIILGTGTNAAFPVTLNGQRYVFNSEWGSFEPKGLPYIKEEIEIYNDMCKEFTNVNFLDVIAANGCKFDLLNRILGRKENLITKDNYKELLLEDSPLYDVLMKRSKQIIAGMTWAVISINKPQECCNLECLTKECLSKENWINDCSRFECLIVTNGSGFDNVVECKNFEEIMEVKPEDLENVNLVFYRDTGLTITGSALYTLHYLMKNNN